MRHFINTAVLFLFLLPSATAQDTIPRYQRLDAAYLFGGQIYNNSLVYNPGVSIQITYGRMLNESVGVGLGTGYTGLEHENFIPVFIEAIGYKKNKASTPLIKMQAGYSFAWYSGNMEINGYDFHGGIYFEAGMGRKIAVNQTCSVLFQCAYRHQFAHMKYKIFGGADYNQAMNYDLIVISLGIIRKSP
jgi:hypothetical protein